MNGISLYIFNLTCNFLHLIWIYFAMNCTDQDKPSCIAIWEFNNILQGVIVLPINQQCAESSFSNICKTHNPLQIE